VIVVREEDSGAEKLGFEFLDGPVTPKPEKIPEPKPKRRSPRRKPSGPKGDRGPSSPRGSVPKVPLVKV
jgi:ATP-dependent Clp protease ATP-binding subunit ClpA